MRFGAAMLKTALKPAVRGVVGPVSDWYPLVRVLVRRVFANDPNHLAANRRQPRGSAGQRGAAARRSRSLIAAPMPVAGIGATAMLAAPLACAT